MNLIKNCPFGIINKKAGDSTIGCMKEAGVFWNEDIADVPGCIIYLYLRAKTYNEMRFSMDLIKNDEDHERLNKNIDKYDGGQFV